MLLKLFVVKNTVYRVVIDWGIFSVKIIEVKVPLMNFYSLIRIYTSRSDVPLRHLLIPTKPDFFNEFLSPWNLPPFCSTIRISPLTVGPQQWRRFRNTNENWSICWSIRHLHISHNTPCLTPKIYTSIVSNFSWGDCNTQKFKLKVTLFGGGTRGGRGGTLNSL